MNKKNVIPMKIMVASSVYGFEENLQQICATLRGFGYDVLNSHIGTIPVNPHKSNQENCIEAVKNCDLFLGIIRPFYGSGIVGPRSITHDEILTAIQYNKPRWFLAHRDVTFTRQLLRQYMYNQDGSRNFSFAFKKTGVLDDLRVIDMYNDAIQSNVPIHARIGNWAQEFYKIDEALNFIQSQFKDLNHIRKII